MSSLTEDAHLLMEQVDGYTSGLPLYIGRNDDPVKSLRKIRSFLERINRDSRDLALAVASLDRVLDKLKP